VHVFDSYSKERNIKEFRNRNHADIRHNGKPGKKSCCVVPAAEIKKTRGSDRKPEKTRTLVSGLSEQTKGTPHSKLEGKNKV